MVNKRLRDYIKPSSGRMSFGISLKFLAAICELALPYILAYLIDTVAPAENIALIILFGIIMLFCSFIAFVFNIWANRIAAGVSRNVTRALRHDLFKKTCYLSRNQIDGFTVPSVVSRLTSNTYDVNSMVSSIQRMGVRAPILLIGGIIITLTLDVWLALVLIATLPFIIIAVLIVSKRGIPLYSRTYVAQDSMVRTVRENVTGIRVIKALSKTEHERRRFELVNEQLSKRERRASSVMALSSPLMNLFLNLGLVGVIIVGAYRVNSGLTEAGKIIAFMTYFTIILNAMISITKLFITYSKSLASSKRIFEVINAPVEIAILEQESIQTDNHIMFDSVSFSYLKQQNDLTDISFALKKGQTLGIIGDVGSGKSTIINLLMRFYDADKGSIYINGQNVKSIEFEQLYNMFGVAFQNDILFRDKINNNIDFFKGKDREDIIMAAKCAQADDFISDYEEGYDYKLAIKGVNLSGGQKQRLLIARALSKGADIIILDDSSSALDYKTDSKLRQKIRDNYSDATKIIIAQRVSSIKHADKIIVLSDGKISGYGNHDELMSNCTEYLDIYNIQMGGVKDEV